MNEITRQSLQSVSNLVRILEAIAPAEKVACAGDGAQVLRAGRAAMFGVPKGPEIAVEVRPRLNPRTNAGR